MTDAEAFLPNRVAVSYVALYTYKPTSCRGRGYRASVPLTNKSSFDTTDTMIFYVPGGRQNTFLDETQNYLKLTIDSLKQIFNTSEQMTIVFNVIKML